MGPNEGKMMFFYIPGYRKDVREVLWNHCSRSYKAFSYTPITEIKASWSVEDINQMKGIEVVAIPTGVRMGGELRAVAMQVISYPWNS
ncbi:hypothetical protein J6590_099340 [Homalodisca vitripennis]|nr:hypothetical protein J6590_099340 [Homalodisca vitripennis]